MQLKQPAWGGTINAADVTVTFTPVNTAEVQITGSTPVTHTLSDWASTPAALGIPNIGAGSTQEYKMDVTLAPSVSLAGASTIFNFVFTGTQVGL